jgi:hypothetical protein
LDLGWIKTRIRNKHPGSATLDTGKLYGEEMCNTTDAYDFAWMAWLQYLGVDIAVEVA